MVRILFCLLFFLPLPLQAQLANYNSGDGPIAEVHIGRVVYGQPLSGRGGRPWWSIDWPEAEMHFTNGVKRLSSIDIAPDSRFVRLDDPNLFDYPWLFLQQVGRSNFQQPELDALREFLLRGGFVLIDDFHGEQELVIFQDFARRLFPDRRVTPLQASDLIMDIHFPLNMDTQIPGARHIHWVSSGESVAMMAGPQQWLGIYDDAGRLMLAAHHNMDMGDAWQHADDPYYPEAMTNLSYRFGVNYLIYALTQ